MVAAPIVYLRGVRSLDLEAVLNFMYQGEVNVAQDDLTSFLAVAEELQVKGLSQSKSHSQSATVPRSSGTSRKASVTSGMPAQKRQKREQKQERDNHDVLTVKKEASSQMSEPSTSRSHFAENDRSFQGNQTNANPDDQEDDQDFDYGDDDGGGDEPQKPVRGTVFMSYISYSCACLIMLLRLDPPAPLSRSHELKKWLLQIRFRRESNVLI